MNKRNSTKQTKATKTTHPAPPPARPPAGAPNLGGLRFPIRVFMSQATSMPQPSAALYSSLNLQRTNPTKKTSKHQRAQMPQARPQAWMGILCNMSTANKKQTSTGDPESANLSLRNTLIPHKTSLLLRSNRPEKKPGAIAIAGLIQVARSSSHWTLAVVCSAQNASHPRHNQSKEKARLRN